MENLIQNVDFEDNGVINYSDFLAATVKCKVKMSCENLWSVFKYFDLDNTGFISDENLVDLLHKSSKELTYLQAREMIREVDFENNGGISFSDFKKIMEQ